MRALTVPLFMAALAGLCWTCAQSEVAQGLVTEVVVEADVEHRYAVTRVATRMFNPDPEQMQLLLQMTIPKNALVSSFIMEVGGANYTGAVSDKLEARRTYEEANQQGKSAGLLELRDNDLQKLQVRASVGGLAAVTFHVTYEELLHPVNGSFKYMVHLNPGQRVPRASVRIRVMEREAITTYKILELPGQEMQEQNPGTSVTGGPVSDGELQLYYRHVDPPVSEGRGVDGTFALTYDITSHTDGGEVQRVGSYFAHFFSPERLPKMTTHTVFLLDVSLSMYNGKLDSMKEAMQTILRSMQPEDTYEILAFSSEVVSVGTFSGETEEVKKAIRRVRRLVSLGYSNLNSALLQALKAAKTGGAENVVKQVIVFSDGHATSGEVNPTAIRSNVKKANGKKHPIFVLIFSEKSKLLEDISGDSGGSIRYLQYGPATTDQITAFYKEIGQPLMADVAISYPDEEVEEGNVVKSGMSNYYAGRELQKTGDSSSRGQVTEIGDVWSPYSTRASKQPWASGLCGVLRGLGVPEFLCTVREERDSLDLNVLSTVYGMLNHPVWNAVFHKNQAAPRCTSLTDKEVHSMKQVSVAPEAEDVPLQELQLPLLDHFFVYSVSLSLAWVTLPRVVKNLLQFPMTPASALPVALGVGHPAGKPGLRSTPEVRVVLPETPLVDRVGCFFSHKEWLLKGMNILLQVHNVLSYKKRSPVYSPSFVPAVDLDPQFLVHTPGLELPLCFNYEGRAGVSVLLLHDPQSGIVINGYVASVRQRPNLKFFSSLFLRLGPVNLTVTPELLHVDCLGDDGMPQVDTVVKSLWPFYKQNGRKYKRHTYKRGKATKRSHQRRRFSPNALQNNEVTVPNVRLRRQYLSTNLNESNVPQESPGVSPLGLMEDRVHDCSVNSSWEEGVGRIYGNVMVVLSKKRSLDITIGDGLAHFTIRRSRNKRGQRFLGFYIMDQEIFSPQTHGMMGQFISKRVRRLASSRPSTLQTRAATGTAAETPEKVTLEVARRGHRKKSRVSGVVGSRYSLMDKTRVRCIRVHTKGSDSVLDERPRDYVRSCLQC
ncbi:inter-alpha-trypsin inhibitor heavy chain H1-like [Portunus trituberculatus]|uniref:inter-alpha-trypsin inhibitor heavy chain H1-like n=1 Tax=Portunus trituberculatus TaxID=210409 RepID=UPI001E1CBC2C|nr:inter-alpha-trypsin inhibitor heavy chain H1-like [Portunus trituberculatus]